MQAGQLRETDHTNADEEQICENVGEKHVSHVENGMFTPGRAIGAPALMVMFF